MRNTDLTPYAFGEKMVRTLADENGEPLFIAKDVALALGYEWNGSSRIAHVPDEWKLVTSVVTSFGEKDMHVLTEQGLYFFLGRSDKPSALPFQKWLAGEVLPSIRKTGGYGSEAAPSPALTCAPALPDAVSRLKSSVRVSVLGATMQAARLTNLTTQAEIDALYLHYCALVAESSGHMPLPGAECARQAEFVNIRMFAEERLEPCRGSRINASDMYIAFRMWWKARFEGLLPSQKLFGTILQDEYSKHRRGGTVWYVNVAFKEEA